MSNSSSSACSPSNRRPLRRSSIDSVPSRRGLHPEPVALDPVAVARRAALRRRELDRPRLEPGELDEHRPGAVERRQAASASNGSGLTSPIRGLSGCVVARANSASALTLRSSSVRSSEA